MYVFKGIVCGVHGVGEGGKGAQATMLLNRRSAILMVATLICSMTLFAQQQCQEMASLQTSPKKKLTVKDLTEWSIGSSEIRTPSGCMRMSAFLNSEELSTQMEH